CAPCVPKEASTASTPSMLVPDMSPIYRGADMALTAGQLHGLSVRMQQSEAVLIGGQGLLELLALGGIQNTRDRQIYRQRINGFLRNTEFVVQVRARCPARRPHIADQLTLFDTIAFAQPGRKAALMSVQRGELAVVLENDGVAIAILTANEL